MQQFLDVDYFSLLRWERHPGEESSVDNGGYGEIRNNEIERGIEPIAVNLCQPDWVKLAEAFGARGFSANIDTLQDTVAQALRVNGPSLIHLRISGGC